MGYLLIIKKEGEIIYPITSKRIKDLRMRKGWMMAELGDHSDVSQQSISNYERGAKTPDSDKLARMAEALGCTTDYLVGLTDVESPVAWREATNGLDALLNGDVGQYPFNIKSLVVKSIQDLSDAYDNAVLAGENCSDLLLECFQADLKALCEVSRIIPSVIEASTVKPIPDASLQEVSINYQLIAILEEKRKSDRKFFDAVRDSLVNKVYATCPTRFVISGNGKITALKSAEPGLDAAGLPIAPLQKIMTDMDMSEAEADAFWTAMREMMIGTGAREELVNAAIEEARARSNKQGNGEAGGN
ncbi:MAG: helix-turn-helix domain-containing protein [Clostridiales bacterium]|nr:helix-turn-helix domain-containing protein [Clostridiales bacterium]